MIVAATASPASFAQQSASGAVSLVVPFPAGGAADAFARAMQPVLQRLLGQTVIVENIPGVSGILGVQRLLSGPADGRRMLLGSPSETIASPLANRNAQYSSENLRLVGSFATNYMALVARPNLAVSTVDEFIKFAEARPHDKPLSYGSVGHGSLFHIVAEDFQRRARISMLHIPYKGMAPLITDVAGEVLDASFMPLGGPLAEMARHKRLRILGVTSATRSRQLPDVPTLAESSALKGFEYSYWTGLLVHGSTPEPVVQRLSATLGQILKDAGFRKFIEESGSEVAEPTTAEDAAVFYAADVARYRALAKTIKLTSE